MDLFEAGGAPSLFAVHAELKGGIVGASHDLHWISAVAQHVLVEFLLLSGALEARMI